MLEQAATLGGMAALREDGGPELAHLIYNLSPVALAEFGLEPSALTDGAPLPTVALDPDGAHVVVDGARVAFASGETHPDGAAFTALQGRLTEYGAILRGLAEAPPPGGGAPILSRPGLDQMRRLARAGLGLKRLGKTGMRRFLQVLLSNAYDFILDEMPDGPLAGLLAADAVRGAAAGPRSPGTVFSLIYRHGHGGRAVRAKGGMGGLMERLGAALSEKGCTVRTETAVARILLEGDAVTGVETASGEVLSAPLVFSSLGPVAVFAMTGAEAFDIEASRRIRSLRSKGTAAKVNLRLRQADIPGLDAPLSAARLVLAPSAASVEAAFNPSKYGEMSEVPVIEAVRVTGADGQPWLSMNVQYAPYDLDGGWTDAARRRLGEKAVGALSQALPGLPGIVAETRVISPDQIEASTGAAGGHWHHAEMALDQLFTLRPGNGMSRYALGPRGLYLCGASSHPGGDVMGLAGRNAALAAMEDGA